MSWTRNRGALARGFADLEYLPHGRSAWDSTLSSLAYGARLRSGCGAPDLNRWAARHGLPASGAYSRLGDTAMVLWHGTSRERADLIAEHGLHSKRGVWTARRPDIAHSYCRTRSDRFGCAGAMVCLVLDPTQVEEGRDYELEGNGSVVRFHHTVSPEVIEYVLVREEIRFVGRERAAEPRPWPRSRFKHTDGQWRPVRRTPVRFSDEASYSTLAEFSELCTAALLEELDGATPLELLSVMHSLVQPWECLRHADLIDLLDSLSSGVRRVAGTRVYLPAR
jgi:hypothetical protein